MVQAASAEPRYTSASYFALVEQGVLRADDRVELLEGVIVAMSPQNPRHASATTRVAAALRDALDKRAVIRVQLPLVVGTYSVPEPDVAVVSGQAADYDDAHPTTALLVVEVADSSVAEDRLTKAAIYAAANIPEFWIVNLRDDCVEVFRTPDAPARRYVETSVVHRGVHLEMVASEAAAIAVADLLPGSK
jgi:Uma2 family endonuclease